MNSKLKLTALIVALSLGFAACANDADKKADDATTQVEESAEETKDTAEDTAEEEKDAEEDADEAEDAADEADKAEEDAEDAEESEDDAEEGSEEGDNAEMTDEEFAQAIEGKLVLRRSLQAPHGEGSFARIAVITDGDKLVDVTIDELQYFDADSDFVALPNQDEDTEFKAGNAEGKILGSKIMNDEQYSAMMTEKAQSTVSIWDNYKAIQDFVVGKTPEEIKEVIDNNEAGKPVDAVTGATLTSTVGYLEEIYKAATK